MDTNPKYPVVAALGAGARFLRIPPVPPGGPDAPTVSDAMQTFLRPMARSPRARPRWRAALLLTLVAAAATATAGATLATLGPGDSDLRHELTFAPPAPHEGDHGLYEAALIRAAGSEGTLSAGPRRFAEFEWLPPGSLRASEGTMRPVQVLQYWHAGLDEAPPDSDAQPRNRTSLRAHFDALSGELVALDTIRSEAVEEAAESPLGRRSEGRIETSVREYGSPASAEPILCGVGGPPGFAPPFETSGASPWTPCALGPAARADAPLSLALVGRAALQGHDAIVFAVQGDSKTEAGPAPAPVRVWWSSEVPYPLRIETPQSADPRLIDLVWLSAFERGSTAVAPPGPEGPPLPPADARPRQPWGPDDGTVAHPFPLSEAYRRALSVPSAAALRDYVAGHPAAFVQSAGYQEEVADQLVYRTWALAVSDGQGGVTFDVVQTQVRPDVAGSALHVGAPAQALTDWVDARCCGSLVGGATPQNVPARWPTVATLFGRWAAHAAPELAASGANAWGFEVRCDEGCAQPMLTFEAGRQEPPQSTSGAGGPPLALGTRGTQARSTLTMDGEVNALTLTEVRRSGRAGPPAALDPLLGPPRAGDETSAAGLRASVWGAPPWSPILTVAAAALAAGLAGLALWAWSKIHSGLAASAYSKLAADDLADHPIRAKLLATVEARAGIGLPDLYLVGGIPRSSVRHHVRVLERHGRLRARKVLGVWRLFPAGHDVRGGVQRFLLESDPRLRELWERLHRDGTLPAPDALAQLAERWGLSASAGRKLLQRLVLAGLAVAERQGRRVVLRPA